MGMKSLKKIQKKVKFTFYPGTILKILFFHFRFTRRGAGLKSKKKKKNCTHLRPGPRSYEISIFKIFFKVPYILANKPMGLFASIYGSIIFKKGSETVFRNCIPKETIS